MAGDRRLGLGSLAKLPIDTRYLVWSICLHVGAVEPYRYRGNGNGGRKSENKEESPWVALLLVSKTILAEAEQFLYQNTFLFSDVSSIDTFAARYRKAGEKQSLVRRVSVAFRWVDYRKPADGKAVRDACAEDFDMLLRTETEDDIRPILRTSIHESSKAETIKIWTRKLERVMEVLHPVHLNIDLSESFCYPSKCCSLHMLAVRALKETMINYPDQSYTWTIFGVTGESVRPKASREHHCERGGEGLISAGSCPATPYMARHTLGLKLDKIWRITLASGLPGHDAVMKLKKCWELPDWADILANEELHKAPAW